MDQKINVTVNGDTLKILTGTVETPLPLRDERQQSTKFTGNISTPRIMLMHPNGFFNTTKTVVIVDRQAAFIEAESNPGEAVNHSVMGVITLNTEIEELKLGKKSAFPQDDFWQFLKTDGKRFFPDASELTNLVIAVRGFKAKVEAILQNDKDDKSNVNQVYNKKVEVSDFPDLITLEAPIFKASAPVRMVLEVCYNVTNNEVYFWFQSSDYKKMVQDGVNKAIDTELEEITKAGFQFIEK
jgi:hypothetical protein